MQCVAGRKHTAEQHVCVGMCLCSAHTSCRCATLISGLIATSLALSCLRHNGACRTWCIAWCSAWYMVQYMVQYMVRGAVHGAVHGASHDASHGPSHDASRRASRRAARGASRRAARGALHISSSSESITWCITHNSRSTAPPHAVVPRRRRRRRRRRRPTRSCYSPPRTLSQLRCIYP